MNTTNPTSKAVSNQVQVENDIVPKEWDTIIIGSGAGGLATAICLSRAGQKVLVLEQHDVPGGWCHSFYLNGHRFTPGVHYVGLMGKGESTSDLYRGLGIANDLVFFRMNPDGYEHCRIGDEHFDFPSDFDELVARLSERFPKEKKQIEKYLTLVRNVSTQLQLLPKMSGFWDNITIPYRTRHMGKFGLFSLRKVINWHIKNPMLKNILNVQCGDHGLQPRKASFPLHCAVMDHYFKGGYYPMGGGGALIKSMTNAIKKNKGEVHTSQKVNRILLKGQNKKQAIGVELENGQQLFAKRIVSNADPGITYLNLIGKENLSKKLNKKLSRTKYSCTSLMLFLTVDMDLREAGIDSGNIWSMPDMDADDLYDKMMATDISSEDAFEGLFISCTTLKDPTGFDGKHHTLEAITYIDYTPFEKFSLEKEPRSPEYLAFKERLTQKMINGVEKAIPGIRNHIVHQELGTPITNKYYINSTRGNVYGTEKSLKHIGPFAFKVKSEIDDLYMCGASILSHGVAGAGYSGVNTAAAILDCKQDDLLQLDESQEIRIFDADNDSDYPEWLQQKITLKKQRSISNRNKESMA